MPPPSKSAQARRATEDARVGVQDGQSEAVLRLDTITTPPHARGAAPWPFPGGDGPPHSQDDGYRDQLLRVLVALSPPAALQPLPPPWYRAELERRGFQQAQPTAVQRTAYGHPGTALGDGGSQSRNRRETDRMQQRTSSSGGGRGAKESNEDEDDRAFYAFHAARVHNARLAAVSMSAAQTGGSQTPPTTPSNHVPQYVPVKQDKTDLSRNEATKTDSAQNASSAVVSQATPIRSASHASTSLRVPSSAPTSESISAVATASESAPQHLPAKQENNAFKRNQEAKEIDNAQDTSALDTQYVPSKQDKSASKRHEEAGTSAESTLVSPSDSALLAFKPPAMLSSTQTGDSLRAISNTSSPAPQCVPAKQEKPERRHGEARTDRAQSTPSAVNTLAPPTSLASTSLPVPSSAQSVASLSVSSKTVPRGKTTLKEHQGVSKTGRVQNMNISLAENNLAPPTITLSPPKNSSSVASKFLPPSSSRRIPVVHSACAPCCSTRFDTPLRFDSTPGKSGVKPRFMFE